MSQRVHNFSAGPCTLPLSVLEEGQAEFVNYHDSGMSLIEMSHRGKHFVSIYDEVIHFEPLETAYQTINLGIFMVVCVLLGGAGTLWGPVVGAILFHVFKEVTWNYLLGWQWVALGALIVVTVVYFQGGVVGWVMDKYPQWFGLSRVAEDVSKDEQS